MNPNDAMIYIYIYTLPLNLTLEIPVYTSDFDIIIRQAVKLCETGKLNKKYVVKL